MDKRTMQISQADHRKETAQQCVKRLQDLADHLQFVAQLCEADDHSALLACGRLEKDIIKLQKSLMRDVPRDINIEINFVGPEDATPKSE